MMGIARGLRSAFRPVWVSGLVAAVFGLVVTQTTTAATAAPRAPATVFRGDLAGVSAAGPSDAWAVGGVNKPMILHWNGTAWTRAAAPALTNVTLTGVSAPSGTDAWAVGSVFVNPDGADTLALHWNGTAWAQVPTPSPGTGTVVDQLNGVSALSADDAWAAGYSSTLGGTSWAALMLHWDGTQWTQVTVPSPGQLPELNAVDALSPTDVWAVGEYNTGSPAVTKTLLLHWNGTTWTQTASPIANLHNGNLTGVSGASPTDVWAVGQYSSGKGGFFKTLVLHWNGTTWTHVPSPNPGGKTSDKSINSLSGVTAVSSGDAWAVGTYGHYKGQGAVEAALILRWNGTMWVKVPAPPVSASASGLSGVAALSPSQAWAVGGTYQRTGGSVLVLSWNGTTWTRS